MVGAQRRLQHLQQEGVERLTSTLSLAAGSLIMLLSWATRIAEAPKIDFDFWKALAPVRTNHLLLECICLLLLVRIVDVAVFMSYLYIFVTIMIECIVLSLLLGWLMMFVWYVVGGGGAHHRACGGDGEYVEGGRVVHAHY